jgi:hypothetical protein
VPQDSRFPETRVQVRNRRPDLQVNVSRGKLFIVVILSEASALLFFRRRICGGGRAVEEPAPSEVEGILRFVASEGSFRCEQTADPSTLAGGPPLVGMTTVRRFDLSRKPSAASYAAFLGACNGFTSATTALCGGLTSTGSTADTSITIAITCNAPR